MLFPKLVFPEQYLKPCPFCGGKAEIEYTPWDEETSTGDDGTGHVICTKCRAMIFNDVPTAVELWNRRVSYQLPNTDRD